MGMSSWGGGGGDRFLVLVVVARGKGMAKISPSISEGKGAHRRGEVDQLVDDIPCRLCPVYGLDGPRRLHGWGPRVVTCRCPVSNCPSVGLSVCPLSVCRLSSSPSPPPYGLVPSTGHVNGLVPTTTQNVKQNLMVTKVNTSFITLEHPIGKNLSDLAIHSFQKVFKKSEFYKQHPSAIFYVTCTQLLC